MRVFRLPDEHVADMFADGAAVLLTLRWHVRTPRKGDLLAVDTLGTWQVTDLLREARAGFGAVVRAVYLHQGNVQRDLVQ